MRLRKRNDYHFPVHQDVGEQCLSEASYKEMLLRNLRLKSTRFDKTTDSSIEKQVKRLRKTVKEVIRFFRKL